MARRTRRPRVVWLPQDPFFSVDAATAAGSTVMRISDTLTVTNIGDSVTIVAPVVRDASPNPLTVANTLSDINNSGYRLRRIVGKFWVAVQQNAPATNSPGAAVVSAALIILRTDPGSGASVQNPVAAAYSANDILNTESPYIWRRSWLVVDNGSINAIPWGDNATAPNAPQSQASNLWIGGNSDGPHIDQKTARVVGPDERLFWVITATSLTAADPQTPMLLDYVYDVRVLVSMRNTVGNRGNASR